MLTSLLSMRATEGSINYVLDVEGLEKFTEVKIHYYLRLISVIAKESNLRVHVKLRIERWVVRRPSTPW